MNDPSFHEQVRQELEIRDTVLHLVETELDARGISYTSEMLPEGYLLDLDIDVQMFLGNLTESLKRVDPIEWPVMVARHVAQLDSRPKPSSQMSAVELREQIRTRLIAASPNDASLSYARPFAPGIIQVLCLDHPTMVSVLSDDSLPELALPIDQLWQHGQVNTDNEAIDEQFDIDEFVHALAGDSFFIASKAANFTALVPTVIGPAPLGVAFALPYRHLLLYSVITKADAMVQLVGMSVAAQSICDDPEADHPGGIISCQTYYWAPDGTIEQVTSEGEVHGEATTVITPGDAFSRFVDF